MRNKLKKINKTVMTATLTMAFTFMFLVLSMLTMKVIDEMGTGNLALATIALIALSIGIDRITDEKQPNSEAPINE